MKKFEEYYEKTAKLLEEVVKKFNEKYGEIPESSLLLCLLVFCDAIIDRVNLNDFERNVVFLALSQMLCKVMTK